MNEQARWDEIVKFSAGGSFLQSWAWGEVQERFGTKIWRLEENGAVALVLKREIAGGQSWLYVPRGPAYAKASPYAKASEDKSAGEASQNLLKKIIDLGREQKSLFIKIEPSEVPGDEWRKADQDVQPKHSLILDLTKSEEELLTDMHQKTRYNIRLAEKKGVRVNFDSSEASLNRFLKLNKDVSARGTFNFHPDNYYRAMWEVLGSSGRLKIAVAEYEGEVLAAHILISFGDTVTYAHGASSSSRRELMAPHWLQWESIKRAKTAGYKKYDFFGVAPPVAPPAAEAMGGTDASHPWSGITRFKEGFGGERVEYPGAYDLVLNKPGYWLYTAARRMQR